MAWAVCLGEGKLRGIPLVGQGPSQWHGLGLCKWTEAHWQPSSTFTLCTFPLAPGSWRLRLPSPTELPEPSSLSSASQQWWEECISCLRKRRLLTSSKSPGLGGELQEHEPLPRGWVWYAEPVDL